MTKFYRKVFGVAWAFPGDLLGVLSDGVGIVMRMDDWQLGR